MVGISEVGGWIGAAMACAVVHCCCRRARARAWRKHGGGVTVLDPGKAGGRCISAPFRLLPEEAGSGDVRLDAGEVADEVPALLPVAVMPRSGGAPRRRI